MWLAALVTLYLACGAVLVAVLLQGRASATPTVQRRNAATGDPHGTATPEMVFRTHT